MTNVLTARNLPHPDKQVTPARRSRANGKTKPGIVGYDKLPVGACPRCREIRPQTAWVDVMVGTAIGQQHVCQSCADQAAPPKASDPVDVGKTLARYRLDYRRHGAALTPVLRFLMDWHEYGGDAWKAQQYLSLRLLQCALYCVLNQQTRGGHVVSFAANAEAARKRLAEKKAKGKRKAAAAARKRNRREA